MESSVKILTREIGSKELGQIKELIARLFVPRDRDGSGKRTRALIQWELRTKNNVRTAWANFLNQLAGNSDLDIYNCLFDNERLSTSV